MLRKANSRWLIAEIDISATKDKHLKSLRKQMNAAEKKRARSELLNEQIQAWGVGGSSCSASANEPPPHTESQPAEASSTITTSDDIIPPPAGDLPLPYGVGSVTPKHRLERLQEIYNDLAHLAKAEEYTARYLPRLDLSQQIKQQTAALKAELAEIINNQWRTKR